MRVLAHAAMPLLFFALILLGGYFPMTVTAAPPTPQLLDASLSAPGLAASAPAVAVTSLEAAPVPLTVLARAGHRGGVAGGSGTAPPPP